MEENLMRFRKSISVFSALVLAFPLNPKIHAKTFRLENLVIEVPDDDEDKKAMRDRFESMKIWNHLSKCYFSVHIVGYRKDGTVITERGCHCSAGDLLHMYLRKNPDQISPCLNKNLIKNADSAYPDHFMDLMVSILIFMGYESKFKSRYDAENWSRIKNGIRVREI
jgi:hypothetical protein